MDLSPLIGILPALAGGSGLALIIVAVWFANSARRLVAQADTRYDREVEAHDKTKAQLELEREKRFAAEGRIKKLEWEVAALKREMGLVSNRVTDLEGNGT